MFLRIQKTGTSELLYIQKSVRKGKKVTSLTVKRLGKVASLMEEMKMSREEVLSWGKKMAEEMSDTKEELPDVVLRLSQSKKIIKDERRSFLAGYLFLQDLYCSLGTKNIFRNIKKRHNYEYDLDAITSDLVYARILEPGSKRSSYETALSFLEPPKYERHDVYRALSVLAQENDYIQSEIYKNSNLLLKRNNKVLYYDVTNYTFEIEEEDDLRRYGKAKSHRPSPIVQMGLFMDGNGIPLAFDLFEGNKNEQPSLIPLEKKILKDFDFQKFVVCTDAGLGSEDNRFFNDIQGRAFITTHSLKKLKKADREAALSSQGWKRVSDRKEVDIDLIRREKEKHLDELFYKEDVYGSKKVKGQLMIITYSPKYALYEEKIRGNQVERAKKMIENNSARKQRHNPNDPARFIELTSTTENGEVAKEKYYSLNQEKIDQEAYYDGYYALCTDLVDEDIADILKIAEGRWEIEETFRIMKTDFRSQPVYVRREDRIKAHFLTCYLSILIFRILEKKLNEEYTTSEILKTLREYRLLRINGEGYLPEYTRSDLTDKLHELFDFSTDSEITTARTMRSIIAKTKK